MHAYYTGSSVSRSKSDGKTPVLEPVRSNLEISYRFSFCAVYRVKTKNPTLSPAARFCRRTATALPISSFRAVKSKNESHDQCIGRSLDVSKPSCASIGLVLLNGKITVSHNSHTSVGVRFAGAQNVSATPEIA